MAYCALQYSVLSVTTQISRLDSTKR